MAELKNVGSSIIPTTDGGKIRYITKRELARSLMGMANDFIDTTSAKHSLPAGGVFHLSLDTASGKGGATLNLSIEYTQTENLPEEDV